MTDNIGTLYGIIAIAVILLITVIILLWYNTRLRKHNAGLRNTIESLNMQERRQMAAIEKKAESKLTPDEKFFKELCKKMDEETPFTNPEFSREELARLMGTNRTYLGEVIKQFTNGLTTSNFITRYRLRYCTFLLITRPELSINDIGEMAGFASRTTYYRLFRDFYKVSPTAFRDSGGKVQ